MKYAIIESGGKQFKAVEDAMIDVDRLQVDVGSSIKLEKVLLLVENEKISIGNPTLLDKSVLARVIDHVKGRKVITFKYRPKKRIRVKTGHRQSYTRLLIEQVGDAREVKPVVAVEEQKPVKKAKTEKAVETPETVKVEKLVKTAKPATEKVTKTVAKQATISAKTPVKKTVASNKKPAAATKKAATSAKKPASTKATSASKKAVKEVKPGKTEKKPAAKKTTKAVGKKQGK